MDQCAQFVALHQEALYSMAELCQRFDAFRREFNQDRPHEALAYQIPASL